MKYIKTPVRPGKSGEDTTVIYDADDRMLVINLFRAGIGPALNEIVLAVNTYDALVEACKLAQTAFKDLVKYYDIVLQDEEMDREIDKAEEAIVAALVLAKGGYK